MVRTAHTPENHAVFVLVSFSLAHLIEGLGNSTSVHWSLSSSSLRLARGWLSPMGCRVATSSRHPSRSTDGAVVVSPPPAPVEELTSIADGQHPSHGRTKPPPSQRVGGYFPLGNPSLRTSVHDIPVPPSTAGCVVTALSSDAGAAAAAVAVPCSSSCCCRCGRKRLLHGTTRIRARRGGG